MGQLVHLLCATLLLNIASAEVDAVSNHSELLGEKDLKNMLNESSENLRLAHNHTSHKERLRLYGKVERLKEVKHFYLWTRSTAANASEILDPTKPETISKSTFKSGRTYIITHGFLGWGTEDWIIAIKDKLLELLDCNVIAVDWPAGSDVAQYYIIVGRVLGVSQDIAYLMKALVDLQGLHLRDVHAIGHSLGAHASGLAAKVLPVKFGRITGLDPAGLMYHNCPPKDRLDKGDAEFVDVMHTNGCNDFWDPWLSCYGIDENLGHVDFWPNGGEYQPACHNDIKGDIGCDHMMSYKYFLESISYSIEDTLFLARNCSDWGAYAAGNCPCGDGAQYMGFYANPEMPGIFYLNTTATYPYAERDAACLPGKTVSTGVITIAASTGSGLLLLMAIIIGTVVFRKRRSQEVNSGLIIEEEEDEDLFDEIIDVFTDDTDNILDDSSIPADVGVDSKLAIHESAEGDAKSKGSNGSSSSSSDHSISSSLEQLCTV